MGGDVCNFTCLDEFDSVVVIGTFLRKKTFAEN